MRAQAEQLNKFAGDLERGAAGERAVAQILRSLPSGYVSLHDLDVPGAKKANIDHLVIGPAGVFVIDAKNWHTRLTAGNGTWWRGKYSIDRDQDKVAWQAQQMSNALGVPVHAVLCFVDTVLPEPERVFGSVHACHHSLLCTVVERHPVVLDPAHIANIANAAQRFVRCRVPSRTPASSAWAAPRLPAARTRKSQSRPPQSGGQRKRSTRPEPIAASIISALLVIVLTLGVVHNIGKIPGGQSSPAVTTGPAALPSTKNVSNTPTVATDSVAVTTTSTEQPFLPPTVSFDCGTSPGEWTATPTATEFRSDPDGYNMWYHSETAGWIYWGKFKSGSLTPYGISVKAGETLWIKMHRGSFTSPDDDPTGTYFTAPTTGC